MTKYSNTYISSWFFTLNSSKINHFRKNCSEVRESGIGKERDHKIVSLCSNVNFISLILVFIASEEYSYSLGHSWCDWPLFYIFDAECSTLWRNYCYSLRNWCSIDYFDCGCVRFIQLVTCVFDLWWVDWDEGVSGCFLKLVCIDWEVHLLLRVLLALLSVFLSRACGRKVVLRSFPKVLTGSVIGFITS